MPGHEDGATNAAALNPTGLETLTLEEEFNLDLTLNSGQVFHWQRTESGFAGTIGSTPVYLEQRGTSLVVTRGTGLLVRHYLSLDHPIASIQASMPKDEAMADAMIACRGLRIIRQPLWECLATFITSALKQVAHIAQISLTLRRRFGLHVGTVAGREVFAYPSIETIARLQEADLRQCGLGFRSLSLLKTAQELVGAPGGGERQLEAWRVVDRAAALATLTNLRGVGTKVANCVLLFGYGHLDAFPIDVWIERVLRERYFQAEPKAPLHRLQEFARKHFGPYGGYAQQYLFHHARSSGRKVAADVGKSADAGKPSRRVRTARRTRGKATRS